MLTHTTTNSYVTDRFSILKLVEGYRQYAYVDTVGVATIGIGFNLRIHQEIVLRTFGFDLDRNLRAQGAIQADAAEQKYIEQVRTELNRGDHTNASLQTALQQIMTARYDNTIYPQGFSRRKER